MIKLYIEDRKQPPDEDRWNLFVGAVQFNQPDDVETALRALLGER